MISAGPTQPNDGAASGVASESRTGVAKRHKSSWNAKQKGQKDKDADFLSEMGNAQNYNINVDHGGE